MSRQRVGLRYVGPGNVRGVPASDLSSHQLDRLVYVRTIPGRGRRGLRRGDPGFIGAHRSLLRDLLQSGIYVKEENHP